MDEHTKNRTEHITTHGNLTIQEFEKISSGVTRRTLQRELKELIEKEIVESSGATNNLLYKLNQHKKVSK